MDGDGPMILRLTIALSVMFLVLASPVDAHLLRLILSGGNATGGGGGGGSGNSLLMTDDGTSLIMTDDGTALLMAE